MSGVWGFYVKSSENEFQLVLKLFEKFSLNRKIWVEMAIFKRLFISIIKIPYAYSWVWQLSFEHMTHS